MTTKNRLARETSPYLLQHAENPVDWYPWGAEALQRAESEDRPILLSVGYAACHFCHVMERECFEDPAIAALMNEHFVCVKVDREERPDIDDIYMTATVAMTGRGGWPMTVFLTPEQAPFFAGTYFPPDDRQGMLGFRTLLRRIAELWQGDRDQLFRQAGELAEYVRQQSALDPPASITSQVLDQAVSQLARSFDPRYGGFGQAPKFPPSQALHLLLRHHLRTGDAHAMTMLKRTLDGMKDGGIYDHVGGGFARYSTDERWLVPHFEKMLYDNAQLARVYLEAYQVTRDTEYRRVARETLDYVVREMQTSSGGYASAIDADSEGVEGRYYTFTTKELRAILEPEEVRAFCGYYAVSEAGNWEGTNVLHTPRLSKDVAADLALSQSELDQLVAQARVKVSEARRRRVPPLLDDKIVTSWNGLMIGTMAEAARVLDAPGYLDSARRAASFISEVLTTEQGRLLRTARDGRAHLDAYLEDYAYLADALVDLYEASAEPNWLEWSRALCERLLSDFHDPGSGAFFQTASDHEELLVRTRDGNDGAMPNANAVAARALLRVGEHLQIGRYRGAATAALRAYGQRISKLPRAHLTSLNVLDALLVDPVQLVFAGEWTETAALRRAVSDHLLPHRLIAYANASAPPTALTANKQPVDGKAALYICRNHSCEHPITSPADAAAHLQQASRTHDADRRPLLASIRIAGRASAEGTRRYHDRHRLDESAVHPLADTGLLVSRVGFGGYRLHKELPDHQRAVMLALESGCNLIDTAATYTRGGSERTIGDALSEQLRRGNLQRDEVVIVSKLGMLQGAEPPAGALVVEPGLAYSLEPELLQRQLDECLSRLNLETLDVCLLHNPETLLDLDRAPHESAPRRDPSTLHDELARAFQWLETQVQAGRIAWYGISSNALTQARRAKEEHQHEPTITFDDLERLTPNAPHFKVIELPLNPLETCAVTDGSIERAASNGWAVLTHRPLNALTNGSLWRLADAAEQPDAPELGPHRTALAMLEQEFRQSIGAVLQAVPDARLKVAELLTWSERLSQGLVSSRAAWNEFERSELAPELSRVLSGLDQAFAGKELGQLWRDFKKRYTQELETCVLAARSVASRNTNRRNRPIADALAAQPGATADAALSQLVVWTVGSLPGVTSVLCGMREPSYVAQLSATLRWDAAEQPLAALTATEALGREA